MRIELEIRQVRGHERARVQVELKRRGGRPEQTPPAGHSSDQNLGIMDLPAGPQRLPVGRAGHVPGCPPLPGRPGPGRVCRQRHLQQVLGASARMRESTQFAFKWSSSRMGERAKSNFGCGPGLGDTNAERILTREIHGNVLVLLKKAHLAHALRGYAAGGDVGHRTGAKSRRACAMSTLSVGARMPIV